MKQGERDDSYGAAF